MQLTLLLLTVNQVKEIVFIILTLQAEITSMNLPSSLLDLSLKIMLITKTLLLLDLEGSLDLLVLTLFLTVLILLVLVTL